MDATTQLSTDVPLYFRFYLPTTGAPYAPTPAPTVTVYRVNEADGTRTALVAALTALTAISGLTGAYTYLLDDSLNTALGQVVGEAVTTDAALTPYPEYATRTYIAQAVDIADTVLDAPASAHNGAGTIGALINLITSGAASASAIWNYLVSSLGATTTAGGYFKALLDAIKAKTDTLGTGSVTVTSAVVSSQQIYLTQGDDYLAVDGRSLDFTYSGAPDFTGGTTVLRITYPSANYRLALAVTGTVLNSTTLRFQPTRTQTATLPEGTLSFEVEVTLADASVITPTTLHVGHCIVAAQAPLT